MRSAVRVAWAAAALLAAAGTAFGASGAEIALSFDDAPGGAAAGFRIERHESGGKAFAPIALVGPGVSRFVDRGLPADATYCYRVRSLASKPASAWSPEVCAAAKEHAAAPPVQPPAPAGGEAAAPPPSGTPPAEEPDTSRIRTSGGWLQVLD